MVILEDRKRLFLILHGAHHIKKGKFCLQIITLQNIHLTEQAVVASWQGNFHTKWNFTLINYLPDSLRDKFRQHGVKGENEEWNILAQKQVLLKGKVSFL